MSGLVLPRHVYEAQKKAAAPAPAAVSLTSDEFVTPAQIRDQVARFLEHPTAPKPAGWRISVLMLTTPDMTDGGLFLLDEERERRAIVSPQGIVVALGPQAYRETNDGDRRFSEGPWCRVGDRILFNRYGGRAFRLANGQVVITLNDTDVTDVMDGGWLDV